MNNSHSVLLAFGSNLGDRILNIKKALALIDESDDIELVSISSFYETEPMGYSRQPDFVNSAALILTTLDAKPLLEFLKNVELDIGRLNRQRWHEREIDIDILLYDDLIINEDRLQIPHKQMHKRNFVLTPAVEIAPDLQHPVLHKSIYELKLECDDELAIVKL